LNTTYNALAERERAAKRLGPHEFFSFIEGRAAMFAGLADSTLSRDDGYRFMVLGRAIERVDMTVRLLLSRVGDSASSPAWVTAHWGQKVQTRFGPHVRRCAAAVPVCCGWRGWHGWCISPGTSATSAHARLSRFFLRGPS
jgi:hypothetical protein